MTMQIGMIASDGIILASDTQATRTPEKLKDSQVGRAVRYHTNCSKIRAGSEIAVSYAQDVKTGDDVANRILSTFTADDAQEAIERIAVSIPEDNRNPVQGLIAAPPFRLFRFQLAKIDEVWTATCEASIGLDYAGDITNAPIYWAERYYDELLTMEQLLPLAAYMITCSHHLNTAGIGGLEVVTCDASGIQRLSRERIQELRRQANETDKQVMQTVFGRKVGL